MRLLGVTDDGTWDRDGWRLDKGWRGEIRFWLVFSILFVGSTLAVVIYSGVTRDMAMQVRDIIGILTIVLVVLVAFLWRALHAPERGTLRKRFDLRPSALTSVVESVAVDLREALQLEETTDGWRDLNKGKDCYRVFSFRSRSTRIEVIREFRMMSHMTVSSIVRIGPVGEGDDDLVDRLRKAIDDAEKPDGVSLDVDFSNVDQEYEHRRRFLLTSWALMIPTVLAFGIVNLMYMSNDRMLTSQEWTIWAITASVAGIVMAMGYWATARLYGLAREEDVS